MVHVSLHWSEQGVDDLSLLGFAVKHAAWMHNITPIQTSGLTPLELLIKRLIIKTCCIHMCGVVKCLFLTLNCKMGRKSQNEINIINYPIYGFIR
ncbi:hypothetical protein ACHAW6_008767 [Cyclotella cf. meneghiniana]